MPAPVHIRIPGRVGRPAATIQAGIDTGMWLNIKATHLADVNRENEKKSLTTSDIVRDIHEYCCRKCNNLFLKSSLR